MFRTKLFRIGLVSATVIVAGGGLAASKLSDKQYSKSASDELSRFEPTTKWDFNWDKREPSSLIKPKKHHSLSNVTEKPETKNGGLKTQDDLELVKKHTSKATRHLFLIRHGQYEIKEKESEKKILTQLGNC